MTKPKPKFPFAPDCEVRLMGEILPARYIRRLREVMDCAWVQLDDGAVCSVSVRDLYKPSEDPGQGATV